MKHKFETVLTDELRTVCNRARQHAAKLHGQNHQFLDDVASLAQEKYFEAANNPKVSNPVAFALTCARNYSVRLFNLQHSSLPPDDSLCASSENPFEMLQSKEVEEGVVILANLLASELKALPQDVRTFLTLYVKTHKFDAEACADDLGITQNAVRKRFYRVMEDLYKEVDARVRANQSLASEVLDFFVEMAPKLPVWKLGLRLLNYVFECGPVNLDF